MGDWLVPVSRHVRFAQASGHSIDGTVAALQGAALAGRLAKAVCEVRGPLVEVVSGDQIWFSTNELEAGVFAVGRARRPTTTKKPTFTVALERTRTRVLASDPLPGVTIRRWVPELRQGSVLLDLRPRALAILEGWCKERGERDVELLSPIGVTPWRIATPKATGARQPARDEVLGPITRLLRSQDFAVGLLPANAGEPWIVGRRVRDVVAIDIERVRGAKGRDAALAALGGLREFKWRVERESARELKLRASLWMAFAAKPLDDVVAFLEHEEVLVSWQNRQGLVELTDHSKQRWYQYLGVR